MYSFVSKGVAKTRMEFWNCKDSTGLSRPSALCNYRLVADPTPPEMRSAVST